MLKNLYYQKKVLLLFTSLLFIYFLCRLSFLILNPTFFQFSVASLFESFLAGLLFDTSAIIYTNSFIFLLLLIPSKIRDKKVFVLFVKWYFFIINSLCILLNLIDTEYYTFSGKRTGIEIFSLLNDLRNVWLNYLFDYWHVPILLVIIIYLLVYFFRKFLIKTIVIKLSLNLKQVVFEVFFLLVYIGLAIIGARGGINLTPINTFDAARFTNPQLVPLVVNTPFQFIMSIQQVGLTEKRYFPESTVLKYYNPVKDGNQLDTSHVKPNIVILILESFGKEYVGYYNKGKGHTPFLDSLLQKSVVYTHAYANGKRSIEGVPAIISSLPTWMNNDYPSSFYQSNQLNGIGSYLSGFGYNSSFYHGGKNGTMSFNNFVAITNNGGYYGLNEYPNSADYDQHWGIFDEPYLQYFAGELSKKPIPFYSTLFTISSHHPYLIPNHFKSKFSEGSLPIHRVIKYTDYALRQFFSTAKKQPWFSNTIFIITADHSSENETAYYQTEQGKFEIPLLVYSPNADLVTPKTVSKTVQHIDIMPMVLDFAKYNQKSYSFGENLNQTGWAIQYTNGFYQLIKWPYVYQFDGEKPLGFYNLKLDSLMKKNQLKNPNYVSILHVMDTFVKCVIQKYNHDLINNKTKLK